MSESTLDRAASAADISLCRCALYTALSLGFQAPSEETIARLGGADSIDALADAAAPIDGQPLAGLVRRLAQMRDTSALRLLEAAYRRVFGHTSRGVAPPYETEYGDIGIFLQPQEMGDIGAFFRAFGLVLDSSQHERIDHISCECEFMAFLCRKQAYALESDDPVMGEQTVKAQRLFLREHLGRFGPAFGRRVRREAPDSFYGVLGELCTAFLEADCRFLDAPCGPQFLQLCPDSTQNVPMACGSCTELCEARDDTASESPL
ncbi:MAG: molecular chaperone TorD family protein [Candidatus Hydrogenedentes bacterium]|nr:molecular chaperone TorD family protein [Candidatus Hydrogenedentota bacterium]